MSRSQESIEGIKSVWMEGYNRGRTEVAEIREILTRYLAEPNRVVAAAVRPEIRRWLARTDPTAEGMSTHDWRHGVCTRCGRHREDEGILGCNEPIAPTASETGVGRG